MRLDYPVFACWKSDWIWGELRQKCTKIEIRTKLWREVHLRQGGAGLVVVHWGSFRVGFSAEIEVFTQSCFLFSEFQVAKYVLPEKQADMFAELKQDELRDEEMSSLFSTTTVENSLSQSALEPSQPASNSAKFSMQDHFRGFEPSLLSSSLVEVPSSLAEVPALPSGQQFESMSDVWPRRFLKVWNTFNQFLFLFWYDSEHHWWQYVVAKLTVGFDR